MKTFPDKAYTVWVKTYGLPPYSFTVKAKTFSGARFMAKQQLHGAHGLKILSVMEQGAIR